MTAKVILVVCAQALLVQYTLSQCTSSAAVDATGFLGPAIAPAFAYDGFAAPFAYDGFPGYGFLGPWAYNGFRGPFGFEGCGAPFAYDGFGPYGPYAYDGFGPFGYDGFNGWGARGLGFNGLLSAMDFTPTRSGGFTVTSSSAVPPTGLTVYSENVYEGIVNVAGEVPFIGTTGMEGILPTAGTGAINHACGNGINAMVSETTAFVPGYPGAVIEAAAFAPAATIANIAIAPAAAIAPAYTGCGCGGIIY